MKSLISCFLFALFTVVSVYGQEKCMTTIKVLNQIQNSGKIQHKVREIERFTQQWIDNNSGNRSSVVHTIPVVVHVIYANATQNVSDAQIQSQIDALNRDFRKQNADISNVPSEFSSLTADVEMEFCLATTDPSGNTTTGITRTQTSVSAIGNTNNYFSTANGGKDIWDANSYLNLWICEIGGGTLGYTYIPGAAPAGADGVVIDFNYFGTLGTVQAPMDQGRTAVHEIGHWFNLEHIWGMNGGCSDDDGVSDTPMQDQDYSGCPSHPSASCNSNDMFMNYMDYVDDNCMVMFSEGQKQRMLAALNGPRASLLNSQGCAGGSSTSQPDDAGVSAIVSPTGSICSDSIHPTVTIKSYGNNTLTSVIISYDVDGGTANTFNWSGSLASGLTTDVNLPAMFVVAGTHTFNASTSQPNGNVDSSTNNDATSQSFTSAGSGGQTVTLTLTPDNYSEEISWVLNDANGSPVQTSNGVYAAGISAPIVESWCLSSGCYDFVITDAFGDGICCAEGSGNYSITDSQGNALVTGNGQYGSGETQNFCLNTATALSANFAAQITTVCVGAPVTFTDQSTGSPTTWSWQFPGASTPTSGNQNPVVTYNTPGTFDVTLDVSNGSNSDSKVISSYIVVSNSPGISGSLNDVQCFGGADGSIVTTISGGSSPYSYQWSDGSTNSNLSTLTAGNYSVTVSNSSQCTSTQTFTISEPLAMQVTSSSTNASCGNADGTASVTASGSGSSFTYLWDNSAGNQTQSMATGLVTGTYSVTVTDGNGCTANSQTTISNVNGPTVTLASTNASCFGSIDGSADAQTTGNSPFTYLWSNGTSSSSISGLSSGNYSISVTDASGCVTSQQVVISEPTEITATTNATQEICGQSNGSISVSATGGNGNFQYLWNTNPAQNTSTATGLGSGTYQVLVTDGMGCTMSFQDNISNSGNFTAGITNDQEICEGNTVQLLASGGGSYIWSEGSSTATISVSPTVTTDYYVTVTSPNGCTDVVTVNVKVNVAPVTTISSSADSICPNESVQLSASGGMTYLWNTGESTSTVSVSPSSSTTYFATSYNGSCPGNTASYTVFVNPIAPTASASSNSSVTYLSQGGNIAFSSSGTLGNVVSWDFGDGTNSSIPNPSHTYNSTGTFDVILTVSLGVCEDKDTLSIDVYENLSTGITIQGLETSSQIIYPNPGKGSFHLKGVDFSEFSTVEVFDVRGRKVFVLSLKEINQPEVDINLHHLEAGSYFVRVMGVMEVITHMIVLQR